MMGLTVWQSASGRDVRPAPRFRTLFRSRREAVARHVYFDDPRLFEDIDTPADLARTEEMMLCG